MAGQIIGDNTTSGFTGAAFNLTSPKQMELGIHQVTLNAGQKLVEYGVLWMISPSNGNASGQVEVCLYDLDTDQIIPGTATAIPYNGATLTAGGVNVHVKATGLNIDLSAHSGKRIGCGLAPPAAAASSGFVVGIRTLTGPRRNNHTTNQSTCPATFSVASNTANSSWGVYAITQDIASQTVTNINSGNDIDIGQSGVVASLTGFTGLPVITSNSQHAITAAGGTANAPIFNLADRIEGGLGDSLPFEATFTFTDGAEVASGNETIDYKTAEVKIIFTAPEKLNNTFLAFHMEANGHDTDNAEFYYIPYGDLEVSATSRVTVTNAGTFTGWLRPTEGPTAGRTYFYQITVADGGAVVSAGGLTSRGITQSGLTSSGLTRAGL